MGQVRHSISIFYCCYSVAAATDGHVFFLLEILYRDTSGYFDSTVRAENKGFATRQTLCAGSATFQTIAPLHCDIFQQNKLFPPLTTILVENF